MMTPANRSQTLGVNIDHVATLRQARRAVEPSVLEAALDAEQGGADSITVHLREDRRHIQDADVFELMEKIYVPLNLEMSVSPGILKIALKVLPEKACLVPEKRKELTTEGGLDLFSGKGALARVLLSTSYVNTSSTFTLKCRAILNARSREGTYFPFSIARMVWRVTPIVCARSSCVISCIARKTFILFFICLPIPVFSGIIEPEPDIQKDHQAEQTELDVSHHPWRHYLRYRWRAVRYVFERAVPGK